jgi:xylulokinase
MHLGIDLGTSSVKTVLTAPNGALIAQAQAPVPTRTPAATFSEQDPDDWWRATVVTIAELGRTRDLRAARGIGLSGRMHGAVALDRADRVLRPAILWNDGRRDAECDELETIRPDSRRVTGNRAMPGIRPPAPWRLVACGRVKDLCRWAPRRCCLSPMPASCPIPTAPCTRCATACRKPGTV